MSETISGDHGALMKHGPFTVGFNTKRGDLFIDKKLSENHYLGLCRTIAHVFDVLVAEGEGDIQVTLTPDEAQAMLDHHDQEGLSLVGDQYKDVETAKEKIAAAKQRAGL